MSVAFLPNQRARGPANPAQIQKMLDENTQLIQAIVDAQNKGKASESIHFQNILHRNLTYLASLADPNPNLAAIIPPPQSFGQPQPQQSQGNMQPQPSECMPPPPPPAPHTQGPPRPPSSTSQPPNSYGNFQPSNQQQYNQGQYPPASGYSSYGNYNQGSPCASQGPVPNSPYPTPPLSSQQYGSYPNYPQPGYTNAPPQPPPGPAQGSANWYPPTGSQQTSGYSPANPVHPGTTGPATGPTPSSAPQQSHPGYGYNQYSQPGYGANYAAPNPGPSPPAYYMYN